MIIWELKYSTQTLIAPANCPTRNLPIGRRHLVQKIFSFSKNLAIILKNIQKQIKISSLSKQF